MKKILNLEDRMRIESLTENCELGVYPKPMDSQTALNEIARFLLGDKWCGVEGLTQEQYNTEIVYTIESLYQDSLIRRLISK
jgi:hypothetical protein